MARIESDREDLMREARALRRRVEFTTAENSAPVVAGFRDDGAVSIYLSDELMLQFDDENRLRRAFVDGDLYRSQGDTLARLTRRRTETETLLDRHDLTPVELSAMLESFGNRLRALAAALEDRSVSVERQVPDDVDVLSEVAGRVAEIASRPVSLSPPINARR
jgi:hypothetical protein